MLPSEEIVALRALIDGLAELPPAPAFVPALLAGLARLRGERPADRAPAVPAGKR